MSKELSIEAAIFEGRKVNDIGKSERLVLDCQGQKKLKYKIALITFDEFSDQIPMTEFAIGLNDPELGQAYMLVRERKNVKRAAVEITDSLCTTAGCNNGANCVKRKSK